MEKQKRPFPIIHIIGLPGAGKTVLARRLSKKLKLPVFCIGSYRARFSQTPIGEADAWVALFRGLSQRRWGDCILETTGLNIREEFLKTALPFDQIFTIKLEALRSVLFARIRKKKKKDRGGNWLYSFAYHDKYEFVQKSFKQFRKIPANYCINANRLTKTEVYQLALKEIYSIS